MDQCGKYFLYTRIHVFPVSLILYLSRVILRMLCIYFIILYLSRVAISFLLCCISYVNWLSFFLLERCISTISLQVVPTVYKDVKGKAIKSNQVELSLNVSSLYHSDGYLLSLLFKILYWKCSSL